MELKEYGLYFHTSESNGALCYKKKKSINILAQVCSIGSSVTLRAEEAATENESINILAHLFLPGEVSVQRCRVKMESKTRVHVFSVASVTSASSFLS